MAEKSTNTRLKWRRTKHNSIFTAATAAINGVCDSDFNEGRGVVRRMRSAPGKYMWLAPEAMR